MSKDELRELEALYQAPGRCKAVFDGSASIPNEEVSWTRYGGSKSSDFIHTNPHCSNIMLDIN